MFNGMFETVRHDMPREKAISYMNSLGNFILPDGSGYWGSADREKRRKSV